MAQELYANDASTTVAAAAGAPGSGTPETWVVASSASFPSASNVASPPTQFHVADPAAPSELITVTNVAGTTWMVTRGAESTIPVPHSAGYTIAQVLTAGDLTALATYTGDLSLVSGVTEVTSTSLAAPLPVTQGGIGAGSLATYGVLAGGTAATTPVQQIAAGTTGQVLTGNGTGTLPSFQANVGFNNPMSALGDMISGGASGAAGRLSGNTSATKEFLTSTGNGATAAAPQWGTIAAGDIPVLNQNTTGSAGSLSTTLVIGSGGTGAGGSVAALANLGGMPLTGGTFSGAVGLAGNPVSALQAAPKQYVDAPAITTPQFQGYAAWTYDAAGGGVVTVPPTNLTFAAGKYYLTRLPVSAAAMQQTLTGNLSFMWFNGGTGATNCFFGLYGVSGTTATLLGSQTSDVSAASTGYQRKSIGSVTGLAAFPQYYVATLIGTQASSTGCGPYFAQNARLEVALNVGGSTSSVPSRCMISAAATLTSLPSSITLTSGNVTAGFLYPWVAID